MPSVARYCCCGPSCGGGCDTGVSPSSATFTSPGCPPNPSSPLVFSGAIEFGSFISYQWLRNDVTATTNTQTRITWICCKTSVTSGTDPGCQISLTAGEASLSFDISHVDNATPANSYEVEWNEKTTGFACDQTTGKLSGSHAYTAGPCHTQGSCSTTNTPTITVPA